MKPPRRFGLLLALLATAPGARGAAQARISWAPEDRVLVADFTNIVGVASDGWRSYAASANGLVGWDPARQGWELPVTAEDGYPVAERPSALAWSRGEQALVLGTAAGRLWRIEPNAGRVELLGGVPGAVEQLVGDETGDLYVRTASGWLVLAAGSTVPRAATRVPAGVLAPGDRLRALGGTLGLDERLRRWPVTAIAAGTRPDEYYVGTAGGGLLAVDGRTLQSTTLPYGTTMRVSTAVARLNGRLWFAGLAGDGDVRGRASVAASDTSLQRWSWPDPVRDGAPAADTYALATVGGELWAGAADGLYRLDARSRWQRFGTGDGLPSATVTAFATSDSALWIGTRRGACLWLGTACGPTMLPGSEITALAWCGGALWLGAADGLWRASAAELVRADPPGFGGRVQALACRQGELYLAGPRLLLVQREGGWGAPMPVGGGGAIRTLAASATGVWVGGDAGAAHWDPAARAWTTYLVPQDIPLGPVLGVLPLDGQLWLATPAGALRLDMRGR